MTVEDLKKFRDWKEKYKEYLSFVEEQAKEEERSKVFWWLNCRGYIKYKRNEHLASVKRNYLNKEKEE